MKKKAITMGLILSLMAILAILSICSTVGWRPFKNFEEKDFHSYSYIYAINIEEMKREKVDWNNKYHLVKMMNELRVNDPYEGEYDPLSMMYLVYQLEGAVLTYHRIGVTYDPEPIIDIDGKVYRIDKASADRYRDFWENHNRAGYFKIGG